MDLLRTRAERIPSTIPTLKLKKMPYQEGAIWEFMEDLGLRAFEFYRCTDH